MTKEMGGSRINRHTAIRIFLGIAVAVVFVELGIMLLLLGRLAPAADLRYALIDSVLLIVILYPVLYFMVYRPLVSEIAERRRAQDALEQARSDLERRVEERTEELARANQQLRDVNGRLVLTTYRVQEQAEVAQRRAGELQTVLDNLVDGVMVADARGRITMVNESGLRLLGITSTDEAASWGGGFPEQFKVRHVDGRPVAREEEPLARALKGETVVQDDEIILNQRTLRDVYTRISAAPIKDETGKISGAVAVVRDVTELMELDRLKDQFIEVAAHELKTPVTGIRGYAQLILKRPHDGMNSEEVQALQAIDRQTRRISRLIDDLLDISQFRFGQLELAPERISLTDLVQGVIERVAATSTRHSIRVVRADPVVVEGDKARLEQVMVSLLDNAIKYSPRGGPSQRRIDVAITVGNHEAVVAVKDRGIGIPKDKQDKLFEPFYRAHTGTPYDYGGMGVGLYLSNEIIKRHGGRMWFESEEGKGSTFYFILPIEGPTGENR